MANLELKSFNKGFFIGGFAIAFIIAVTLFINDSFYSDKKIDSINTEINMAKTVEEIIISLIDNGKISGEEALTLIKAIDKSVPYPLILPTINPSDTTPCWSEGGICTNPYRDCINCPKLNPTYKWTYTSTKTDDLIKTPDGSK